MKIAARDLREEQIARMRGGSGTACFRHIVERDILGNAARLMAVCTLPPGASVGMHSHEKDVEICFFLSGSGLVREGGACEYTVGPGDVSVCEKGSSHEIINAADQPLEYLALVLYP